MLQLLVCVGMGGHFVEACSLPPLGDLGCHIWWQVSLFTELSPQPQYLHFQSLFPSDSKAIQELDFEMETYIFKKQLNMRAKDIYCSFKKIILSYKSDSQMVYQNIYIQKKKNTRFILKRDKKKKKTNSKNQNCSRGQGVGNSTWQGNDVQEVVGPNRYLSIFHLR